MDAIDQLYNHISAMHFLKQCLLHGWACDDPARNSSEKNVRLLLSYALSQQLDFGDDVSVESIAPLLDHLRGPETLVAYNIDPLAVNSPPVATPYDHPLVFILADKNSKNSIRAISTVGGVIDLTMNHFFLLRAFIQEDHSLVLTLITKASNEPVDTSTIQHPITGSPSVRLFSRVAGQPNALGQIRAVEEHMPPNTSTLLSIYADRLVEYIASAMAYYEIMVSYRDITTPISDADDLRVIEAYKDFTRAKASLLSVENFASRKLWLHEGLWYYRLQQGFSIELFVYFLRSTTYGLHACLFVSLLLLYLLAITIYANTV